MWLQNQASTPLSVTTIKVKLHINDTQYFEDRKGSKLEFDDILHYQKIIVELSKADRLMKEIGQIS